MAKKWIDVTIEHAHLSLLSDPPTSGFGNDISVLPNPCAIKSTKSFYLPLLLRNIICQLL